MPRITHVKKARKSPGVCGRCVETIEKGQGYYWFQPYHSTKRVWCEKHYPRQSELTQSDKLSTAYAAVESIEDAVVEFDRIGVAALDDKDALIGGVEELKSVIEAAKEEIEQVASDYRDSKDNMPESLQDGPTGQEIEEKADALEQYAQELDEITSDLKYVISDIENEIGDQKLDEVGDWLKEKHAEASAIVTDKSGNLSL